MAKNKDKIDSIHDQLPAIFDSRVNPNWSALVGALGGGDQFSAELIQSVRQQFFVKTAQRPYLDRLGSNYNISRPRFVGMDDPTFRRYIPVLAYQPKQVKLILDTLLDIFFFKDSTTAFMQTVAAEPFQLEDGWEFDLEIDVQDEEHIDFIADDFVDINNATADEVVSSINRQSKNFYAVAFEDSVTKQTYIRIFTKTVGSKGSLRVVGGRANVALQFDQSFNVDAGNGNNTEWTVTKIGDEMSFSYTGGNNPTIENVEIGDFIIIDLPGNEGSFEVTFVDVATKAVKFKNLFGTAGVFTQTSDKQVKFLINFKAAPWKARRRAITWEVEPGEILVEMPTSPPVVKRNRKGAAHINGVDGLMINRVSDTELELEDAADWPDDGFFFLEQYHQIKTRVKTALEDDVRDYFFKSRIISDQPKYSYTSKNGNILEGISPALPTLAEVQDLVITSIVRLSNEIVVSTSIDHNLKVGMQFKVRDAMVLSGMTDHDPNRTYVVKEVVSPTQVKADDFGTDGTAAAGFLNYETIGLSNFGSKLFYASARLNSVTPGPYIWTGGTGQFVLSSLTANLTEELKAGNTARLIEVGPNEIPDEQGELIFDFGTERQEGPIRYFYTPTDTTIAIDPAYVFENNHDVGASVTMIRRRGPHILDGFGGELAPYITDPSEAREILKELMRQVKSVGIFINFLIRFPEQYYATIDVYKSGEDPG